MGSLSSTESAYIAGFLDGDGSLMLQLKKVSTKNYRFQATIAFYQDTRHDEPLYDIRDAFNVGYLHRRKDGITELKVSGMGTVISILKMLIPYIRFKKKQAEILLKACTLLSKGKGQLSDEDLLQGVEYIMAMRENNYKSGCQLSKEELIKRLGITP